MDAFKIIVITIAVFILIVMLTTIGMLMSKAKAVGQTFPPTVNQCPDGWLQDGSANCIIPTNGFNLGTLSPATYSAIPGINKTLTEINFADPAWINGNATLQCNQKQWANQMGIVWDTITNNNSC